MDFLLGLSPSQHSGFCEKLSAIFTHQVADNVG
jgi:hypothetical protein